MSIKEAFEDNQSLTYRDIMDYVNNEHLGGRIPFYLFEMSSSGCWRVEARARFKIQDVPIMVVFNEDVFSPYINYNQIQADEIITDTLNSYFNISRLINV